MKTDTAADRLAEIRARIDQAAVIARRDPAVIELVAVSKTYSAAAIMPLLDAGQRSFGENRVQEATAKWPPITCPHGAARLHLIGSLQTNKARDAVVLFDVIHSVDRPSLITALARAMAAGKRPDCYLQVNIGDEPQKGGVSIAGIAGLVAEARDAGLPVIGLMAVPPEGVEPAPFFALLAKLAREHGLTGLSMGMSGDYETAVMLGATCVRIGSALFGPRPPSTSAV